MQPHLETFREAAENAEMWWYICFVLACVATLTLIIGFFCVCFWLRKIHFVLREIRFPSERGLAKAPPLKD